jgi:hypothetical protein
MHNFKLELWFSNNHQDTDKSNMKMHNSSLTLIPYNTKLVAVSKTSSIKPKPVGTDDSWNDDVIFQLDQAIEGGDISQFKLSLSNSGTDNKAPQTIIPCQSLGTSLYYVGDVVQEADVASSLLTWRRERIDNDGSGNLAQVYNVIQPYSTGGEVPWAIQVCRHVGNTMEGETGSFDYYDVSLFVNEGGPSENQQVDKNDCKIGILVVRHVQNPHKPAYWS